MANGMFAGGNGAVDNPYLIEDAADLDAIRRNLTASYKLINNINLGAPPYSIGKGWDPINGFFGTLDGNKKKIFNLYINRTDQDYVGLFGLTAELNTTNITTVRIYDVAIENAEVYGKNNVGILFGGFTVNFGYLFSEEDKYTIIRRVSCSGKVSGNDGVGGIVGYAAQNYAGPYQYNWILLSDCIAKGTVTTNVNSTYSAGGIIGNVNSYGSTYNRIGCRNCISLAKISNTNGLFSGGTITGGPAVCVSAAVASTNFYDATMNTGIPVTPNTVGLATDELTSANPKLKALMEAVNGTESIWLFENGEYPKLAFLKSDCFFIRVNGDYLTWDAAQKQWVKQFDLLPGTDKIWKIGMKSIAELGTFAWNALKAHGKFDIINFVDQTEKLNVEYSTGILAKMDTQPVDSMICFSKTITFADYRNDVVSITP